MRGGGRLHPGEPGTQGSAEERMPELPAARCRGFAGRREGAHHPDMVLVAAPRLGSDLAGARGT